MNINGKKISKQEHPNGPPCHLLSFAMHSWMATRPSPYPGDDRRLPAPPGRLKGIVWCCTCMASWVSLTACAIPLDAPLLAHLASAHGTPCGSPLQHVQHYPMCPCWLTSHVHTQHTWCPCRSAQHTQHHTVCIHKGALHFPVPPLSFLTCTWHCSIVPLGLTCSAHKWTSYLAHSHWSASHAHTTLHSGTMSPACSAHMWGCTTQPSLPLLTCPPHVHNIARHPCGSGSACAPASHVCGHHPCPRACCTSLHILYTK